MIWDPEPSDYKSITQTSGPNSHQESIYYLKFQGIDLWVRLLHAVCCLEILKRFLLEIVKNDIYLGSSKEKNVLFPKTDPQRTHPRSMV